VPTLEDVLVDEIVADPAGRVPKLALADLLAERGLDAEADAARWCAARGLWPYPYTKIGGQTWWHWFHTWPISSLPENSRACLPESLDAAMDAGAWWSDSCLGALALLAAALARLHGTVGIDS
jgi:hypothetical protein